MNNAEKAQEIKDIPFLNIESYTELEAIFVDNHWGKNVNMLAVFKLPDSGDIFKLSVYKNFKEDKYGNNRNFRDIPHNSLMRLKLEPKLSKKTNQTYTKLVEYEVLQEPS